MTLNRMWKFLQSNKDMKERDKLLLQLFHEVLVIPDSWNVIGTGSMLLSCTLVLYFC